MGVLVLLQLAFHDVSKLYVNLQRSTAHVGIGNTRDCVAECSGIVPSKLSSSVAQAPSER